MPATQTDRHERGVQLLTHVGGGRPPAVLDALADLAPDLARYAVEFAYGDVYARPGLGPRERQLATVGALTALGTAPAQLRFHLDGARNVGCSCAEIVEAVIHVAVYAGFPAALNGISAAREAFAARGDVVEPVVATPTGDRFEQGRRALSLVDGHAGEAVISSLADIAPDLARYVVEFAFGDVYSRPGLDLRTREIVTVAACTALGTARPQLKVHLHGLLNVGGTVEEAVETLIQMAVYAGFPAALNGVSALREVLAERG